MKYSIFEYYYSNKVLLSAFFGKTVFVTANLYKYSILGTTGQVDVTFNFGAYSSNFRTVKNAGGPADNQAPYLIDVFVDVEFDRESLAFANNSISFSITGVDRSVFSLTRTYEYNILITDVNDNPPVFVNTPYLASVSESAPTGKIHKIHFFV